MIVRNIKQANRLKCRRRTTVSYIYEHPWNEFAKNIPVF